MGPRPARSPYVSDIPAEATEHELSPWRRDGDAIHLRTVEYRVGGKVVGTRLFEEDGTLAMESPRRDGRAHGRVYEFHPSGAVSCVEPFVDGIQHGTCHQWDEAGRLLGRYVLRNGSGLDVWRHRSTNGRILVSEIRTLRDGFRHGFEWWLSGRQLASEAHFVAGRLHGVERAWSSAGTIERGYPRFWVDDRRVSKRQYLAAAREDRALPPFRERDNRARRALPKTVRAELDRYTARPS